MTEDASTYTIGSLGTARQMAGMIGEFIAAWGMLEHSMRLVLMNVVSIHHEAAEAILYAVKNTSAKIDILADLTRRGDFKRKDELLDALSEVSRLSSKRNELLHCLIGLDQENNVVRWDFRYGATDPERLRTITVDELLETIMEVTDAYNFLAIALHDHEGPRPPWRSKYFQQRPAIGEGSKRQRQRLGRKRRPRR
ncbi:MAG: hypothetical protein CTY28_10240 [Hyphomicrobium sp.]|nr:MAG: hypothetical protein CTY28_10240 [Hyphomicrobium sp.]